MNGCDPGDGDARLVVIDAIDRLRHEIRTGRHAPMRGSPVRTHDGTRPVVIDTDVDRSQCSTLVRFTRHLSWQPILQIVVMGVGTDLHASDLGTDSTEGAAVFLDGVHRMACASMRDPDSGTNREVADLCGLLMGPQDRTLIVRAPTPWSRANLETVDFLDVPVTEEVGRLIPRMTERMTVASWIQADREDVPAHPRATLSPVLIVPGPVDPMNAMRHLVEAAADGNEKEEARWA